MPGGLVFYLHYQRIHLICYLSEKYPCVHTYIYLTKCFTAAALRSCAVHYPPSETPVDPTDEAEWLRPLKLSSSEKWGVQTIMVPFVIVVQASTPEKSA